MLHRRFGRTNLSIPVLSLGGMRYQQAWQDVDWDQIAADGQANLEATVRAAVAAGIAHIETARGYGSSERQLGAILPKLPRESTIVQTKVGPADDADGFIRGFDTSMERLRLEYVDLLAIHGINNRELLERTLKPGGSLDGARRLQADGRARWIGFSTHAPLDVILDGIHSGGFDYVNLHYYWADQRNLPAVEAAATQDMGLFIISPNDKGGQLYRPPAKLVELCAPLTPMAFGDLFCLRRPDIHTLSLGAARPSDLDAHLEAMPLVERADELVAPILARLEAEAERVLGDDWMRGWHVGLPAIEDTPGGLNLYHCLRLFTLAKAFDLVDYARMRYNLFGGGGHWFAGAKIDPSLLGAVREAAAACPVADRIPDALAEMHALLDGPAAARLSES